MKVRSFNVTYNLQRFEGDNFITPFKIVCQTNTKKVEEHLVLNYKDYLTHRILSVTERTELMKMKSYIQRNLNPSDKFAIQQFFYKKNFFDPVTSKDKVVKFTFTGFNAKFWTDPIHPYLEIEGYITINWNKLLELYMRKRYINFKKQKAFIKRDIIIEKKKRFPLIMITDNGELVKQTYLKHFTDNISSHYMKNKYAKQYSKLTGIKAAEIHKYKKNVEYIDNDNIIIEISDIAKLLGKKAWDNKFKLMFGTALLRKEIKDYRQRRAIEAIAKKYYQ